jgi:hypothetical protein
MHLRYEAVLLLFFQLDTELPDTLKLQSLRLDWIRFKTANILGCQVHNIVAPSCRVHAVLGVLVNLFQMLLELFEKFVVILLNQKFVGFIIDNHLEVAEV